MGDLSEFFSRSEFACECGCGFDTVDAELLEILIKVRDHFGRRMDISSGCRCWARHAKIYKDNNLGPPPKKSLHLIGRAADVVIEGITPQLVAEAAAQYGASGIKRYSWGTHIDSRSGPDWIDA